MIDILLPVLPSNVGAAVATCSALLEKTDLVTKIIAILDGGQRKQYAALEDYLRQTGKPWSAIHNSIPLYFNACVTQGIERASARYIAILEPGIIIDDPSWHWKMMLPFGKDNHSAMSLAGIQNTGSSTLPPYVVDKNRPFEHGRFSLILRGLIGKVETKDDIVEAMMRKFMNNGYHCWSVPGVMYNVIDRKDHLACRV